jgi:Stress responsive A/B Barrel Domain
MTTPRTDQEALVIAHVLRFSFKDGTSEEDFTAAMEAFRKAARAATVSFAVVGSYSGNPADGYTHSAIFGLADLETLERFMDEPAHREADFIVHPHMATFDGFDVSDEYDPDLEAKVMAIRRRRIAADPELAALLGIVAADGSSTAH